MQRSARLALVTVPALEFAGFLSGALSGSAYTVAWFAALAKPGFMPPVWVFPVGWTLLYAMLGVALALLIAAPPGRARRAALVLFAVQMAMNLAWPPLFFGAREIQAALALLLALVAVALLATLAAARIDRRAALLMLPYLAWLGFAAALNERIVALN